MAKFPYRQLGISLDRNFRNNLNANLVDIEADIKELGAGAQTALDAADEATTQALYAQEQGDYANTEGTYASEQGDYAKAQGDVASTSATNADDKAAYATTQGDYAKQVANDNKTRFLSAVATVTERNSTYPTPLHGDTVRVTGESKTYRFVTGTGWVVTDVYNPTAIDEVNAQLADIAKVATNIEDFPAQIPEVDDTARLQRAINGVATSTRALLLSSNVTYNISSQLELPLTTSVTIISHGKTTIKATSPMVAMLHKGLGIVDRLTIAGIDFDANQQADICIWLEQANVPVIDTVHLKNPKITGLRFSKSDGTGSLVFEAQVDKLKITGVDSALYPPSARPQYGIELLPGSTDNHFQNVIIRNISASGVIDYGSNNLYDRVHVFGYPESSEGIPTYISDYGIDVVNGRVLINQLYTDGIKKAGVKLRMGYSVIMNSIFFWRFDNSPDWDKSQTSGIEIDSGVDHYIIFGNLFRGAVAYDIRHLGTPLGEIWGNDSTSITNVFRNETRKKTKFIGNIIDSLTQSQEDLTLSDISNRLLALDNTKTATFALGSGTQTRFRIQKQTGTDENTKIKTVKDDGTEWQHLSFNRANGRTYVDTNDLEFSEVGKGIILKSPNGLLRRRLSIDNSGNIVLTTI